ncbi:hypothetical protein GIB67_028275 [Kingdonia uniflora]|uniref:BHLH domain-containing protein n=1 Tax=Kingdonia uniflora TaxID=39325 RepID=A0A7J7KZK1_9MAGN|nr:hypothetical protein GIB67_028275 [Kingdonia uniflora]
MESVGTLTGCEWNNCFSGIPTEEADFMAQLLGNYFLTSEQDGGSDLEIPSAFWPSPDDLTMNMVDYNESLFYCSNNVNSNLHFFPTQVGNTAVSMDFFMENPSVITAFSENQIDEAVYFKEKIDNGSLVEGASLQTKRKSTVSEPHANVQEKNDDTNFTENPRKKARVSTNAQGNRKNVQAKKNNKLSSVSNNAEATACTNGQSCSSCSSEDDSNASQELNGGENSSSPTTNVKGKIRASRGSATDPQSLYARKRRERINERLRILQNLVPNGTKVDISTMLEEAVQYVKFLQLQIKLLSSDDLWMYSPIAYNGMDIGLDMKISLPL